MKGMFNSVVVLFCLFSINRRCFGGPVISIRYNIPDICSNWGLIIKSCTNTKKTDRYSAYNFSDANVFIWFNHFDSIWNLPNKNKPLGNVEQGSMQMMQTTTPIPAASSTSEISSEYDWDDVVKEIEKEEDDKRFKETEGLVRPTSVPNPLPTSTVQQNQISNESSKLPDFAWEDWLEWWKQTPQSEEQQKFGLTNNKHLRPYAVG